MKDLSEVRAAHRALVAEGEQLAKVCGLGGGPASPDDLKRADAGGRVYVQRTLEFHDITAIGEAAEWAEMCLYENGRNLVLRLLARARGGAA